MSNWDLMMPGMGLTAIGLAGVTISYSGIAHTFIDGMHALTGLTMFIGLIFLSAGILEGGVSTSNRAKATTLVIASIALSFGAYAFTINTISTTPIFAGVLLIIATPAIVMAYVAVKMPKYLKPIGLIFVLAAGAGIAAFITFGLVGPEPYLIPDEAPTTEQEVEPASPAAEVPEGAQVFSISILEGSGEEGNPDYEPDVAEVTKGNIVEWTNDDTVQHTVTSEEDFGETFDSGLMESGEKFVLDTSELSTGTYEYFCVVHPWMKSTLVIDGSQQQPTEDVSQEQSTEDVSIPQGAGVQKPGQTYYEPESITVSPGTVVAWSNDDEAVHTVTSGTPETGSFDSEIMSPGDIFKHTFNEGTHEYYCVVHPWMLGEVIVE